MSKSNTKRPLISVVMPVFNCGQYLPEALASLFIQSFTDFEVIAINDGSTDNSPEILERFARIDSRIRIINQNNSGIVKALNRGIKESRGAYIARMDGDDISFPSRFQEQVDILNTKPDVVLVAGDFEVIDELSCTMYREAVAPDDEFIQRAFYLRNAIAHGSVMFRKSIVESLGGYSDKYGPTEDMALWMHLSKKGRFAATGTCVYRWRVNRNGITSTNNPESVRQAMKHLERRWKEGKPHLLNRRVLIRKLNEYYIDFGNSGEEYKRRFLADTAHIAVKYFRQGNRFNSLKQLLVVASLNLQGFHIATNRVAVTLRAHLHR